MDEIEYRDRSIERVFTVLGYTDQGLGHLRVTNALHTAAPGKRDVILFGPDDELATSMHRLSSMNVFTRKLLEVSQNGIFEDIFGYIYKASLKIGITSFMHKLNYLLELSTVRVDRLIFVSTHFGLAHQMSFLKETLIKENNIRVELVVVVTDDSPQKLWLVKGADLTLVPSEETAFKLKEIAKKKNIITTIHQLSYPLNLLLTEDLSSKNYSERIEMSQSISKYINISLPVSGAAVGLGFFEELINLLSEEKFKFSVVSRKRSFTNNFLNKVSKKDNVEVISSENDFEVVEKYDRKLASKTFLFEITKPSEQAFKAMISPKKTGGVILLLTTPVGRQERDNLEFLLRNNLIPDKKTNTELILKSKRDKYLSKEELEKAKNWRAIMLPENSKDAAEFIKWGLHTKLFYNMLCARPKLSVNGAKEFWEYIKY